MHAHQLWIKHSKCAFTTSSMAYLGHVISAFSVIMDGDKVATVASWQQPASAQGLHSFLRLAGYYQRFIKNFGILVAPLTKLLHKEGFRWTDEATMAFIVLKEALSTTPVLHLLDFSKPFVFNCDMSRTGFSAVLHQDIGPLVFYSKLFAMHHLKVAAYERELIRPVQVMHHWCPCLWGYQFIVQTNHYG